MALLKCLSSKQEMVSSKLTATLFLAAIWYMAAKNKSAMSFELNIPCLLDRRFNQLSHAALLIFSKNYII